MKDPRFIFAFSDLRWVVFELEFELTSLGSVFLRAFTSQGPIPSGLGARAYPASHTETRPFVRRRPRRQCGNQNIMRVSLGYLCRVRLKFNVKLK